MNEYSSYLVGAKIGAAIPSILTCLALWLVYTGARKKSSVKGTAGLTILQVFAVLAVVGLILSTLIFGLAAIPVFAEHLLQSFLGLPKEAETAAIVVLILALVVVIFQIVYYCKLSSLYSGAKAMCRNERVKKPASLFVIVVAFIGVLSTLISLISGIVSSPVLYGVVNLPIILDMLSMVAAFVYTLLLAITYIRLRIAEEPFTRAAAARAAMASRTYAQTQQMQPGQIPYGQLVYGQPAQMPYGQPMNGQSAQVPYGQPMYGQPGQMPVQSEPEHSPEPKVQEETRGEEPAETENPLQE